MAFYGLRAAALTQQPSAMKLQKAGTQEDFSTRSSSQLAYNPGHPRNMPLALLKVEYIHPIDLPVRITIQEIELSLV